MNDKKLSKMLVVAALAVAMAFVGCQNSSGNSAGQQSKPFPTDVETPAKVYFTSDISPDGLVRVFEALGIEPHGSVAVKISTGESSMSNHLRPELIGDLVGKVEGTLVECNTAYPGSRMKTEDHIRTIEEHGYNALGGVDIMDADGEMRIPVRDTTYMKYDIVGTHLANYDFMINLAHFKGHAMGGFGGVLKNASIGVASSNGKAYIHTNGISEDANHLWENVLPENQDKFLECMGNAAAAVHDYFKRDGRNIVYIDVMNNMSVDCDCDGDPEQPRLNDIGILASTDPVALDKACLDLVFNHADTDGDDAKPLQERINRQHGLHIIPYSESIGLGTTDYVLINIDKE